VSVTAGISATERIELSLFSSRVAAICEEMGALLGRVAFSPNIRDRLDYSCALFDHQGQLLGQATHIPVHLGSMAHAMRGLVEQFDWQAGDMVLFNDPFRGGTHLPDVTFVCPVFVAGRLIGFCANRAHHADIGSEAPGLRSSPPRACLSSPCSRICSVTCRIPPADAVICRPRSLPTCWARSACANWRY
jgi:N-methylhydantoinase B/oxoprolinase/acetone carboxylase alpha subunit